MAPDPARFAALLCDYCLEVQPGQQVVVRSTTLAAPLLLALQEELLTREAWPLVRAELPGMTGGQALGFAYVNAARGWDELATLSWVSGLTTTYAYETWGPLDSIAVSGGVDLLAYTDRDAVDRITELTHTHGGSPHDYAYGYDPSGRLTDASYPTGLGLPSAPEAFGYDKSGNRDNDPGSAAPQDDHEPVPATTHRTRSSFGRRR